MERPPEESIVRSEEDVDARAKSRRPLPENVKDDPDIDQIVIAYHGHRLQGHSDLFVDFYWRWKHDKAKSEAIRMGEQTRAG